MVVRMSVNPPNVCGAPLEIPVTRSNRLGVVRLPVLGRFSWFHTNRPTRTSHTVLVDKRVRQVPEGHRGNRCRAAQRRFERRRDRRPIGIDPVLVVEALHQLHAGSQPPRELREDFVLLVGSWESWVGARLAVVVAQVLVSREEPQPIANNRAAEVRREVAVPDALVPALPARAQWT